MIKCYNIMERIFPFTKESRILCLSELKDEKGDTSLEHSAEQISEEDISERLLPYYKELSNILDDLEKSDKIHKINLEVRAKLLNVTGEIVKIEQKHLAEYINWLEETFPKKGHGIVLKNRLRSLIRFNNGLKISGMGDILKEQNDGNLPLPPKNQK